LKKARIERATIKGEKGIAETHLSLLLGVLVFMQFGDVRFFNIINDIIFWMSGVVYSLAEQTNQGQVSFGSTAASVTPCPERIGSPARWK
jgi:hypothetical protein